MNFADIYKKIKAIDEGTTPDTTAPTAPGGVIKTKNPDGSVSYRPKVPGEKLSKTFPGSVPDSAAKISTDAEKAKQPANEACGDMMALPTSMGHNQSDSVTMNVSMNGSGDGGIRDLMNILKGIENVGEPHADHDAVDVMFGGEMEPEMEAFANSMAGASGQQTFPQSAVTDIGSNSGRGDHEVRKANGGGNPYTQVSEELVSQLSSLYQEIKEAGEKKTMSRAAKEGKDLDKVRDKYNKYDEAYNPNSVDAEHRRGLEKSQEDSLKKKAADGDESAKKRLQALKDKKERMRNDYNDRMER